MDWTRRVPLVALAVLLAFGSPARCGTIVELLKQADAVVIATATAVDHRSDATTITLSVAACLSGSARSSTVHVLWRAPEVVRRASTPAANPVAGIWFLKRLPDGKYTPIPVGGTQAGFQDLYYLTSPAESRPQSFAYGLDAPIVEKILLELASAAASETSNSAPGQMVWATYGMAGSPPVREVCLSLAQMPGSRQKAIGLACLVAGNDAAGIAGLEANLHSITEQDQARIVAPVFVGAWRNSDSGAVTSLGRIVTDPAVSRRLLWAGVKALSLIHTAEAIPYLTQLLDDQDREVQIDSVYGLWAFANGVAVHDPTRTDNAMYLNPRAASLRDTTSHFVLGRDASEAQIAEAVAFWKKWYLSWSASRQVK